MKKLCVMAVFISVFVPALFAQEKREEIREIISDELLQEIYLK